MLLTPRYFGRFCDHRQCAVTKVLKKKLIAKLRIEIYLMTQ